MPSPTNKDVPVPYLRKLYSLRYPLTLLVILQAFDTLSTLLALGHGAQEGNPVAALGLASAGGLGLFAAKQAVILLVFIGIALDPMDTPYLRAALVIMDFVYATVVSGNFVAIGQRTGDWNLPVAYWALTLAIATVALDETLRRPKAVPSPALR